MLTKSAPFTKEPLINSLDGIGSVYPYANNTCVPDKLCGVIISMVMILTLTEDVDTGVERPIHYKCIIMYRGDNNGVWCMGTIYLSVYLAYFTAYIIKHNSMAFHTIHN